MNNKNKLLIIDYNLVRYDDVKMMVDYAKEAYGLSSVLIRKNPCNKDYKIAEHVIDLYVRDEDFIHKALHELAPIKDQIKAGIVFSDDAVCSGAYLLQELGLISDSPLLANNAFSKTAYRIEEKKVQSLLNEQQIKVPAFAVISTFEELSQFIKKHPQGVVLKPSCEGNNRGVIRLTADSDVEKAMCEVEAYLSGGLICEELIDFDQEYSFDGLGHLSFITEKLSKSSRYPVEYGQIVPAYLSTPVQHQLMRTGIVANLLTGQRLGPFHNEIKLDTRTFQSAIIEPNRRPAGMKIWNLAQKVYGINLYHYWIDTVMEKALPSAMPEPKGRAAIRLLPAPKDGIINFPQEFIENSVKWLELLQARLTEREQELTNNVQWFDFILTKKNGERVFSEAKDNAQFIAQICVYVPENDRNVISLLDALEAVWLDEMKPYIK
jgi:biotin carboxylase